MCQKKGRGGRGGVNRISEREMGGTVELFTGLVREARGCNSRLAHPINSFAEAQALGGPSLRVCAKGWAVGNANAMRF